MKFTIYNCPLEWTISYLKKKWWYCFWEKKCSILNARRKKTNCNWSLEELGLEWLTEKWDVFIYQLLNRIDIYSNTLRRDVRRPNAKIQLRNNIFGINRKIPWPGVFLKIVITYIDNNVKHYFWCIFVTTYVICCHVACVSLHCKLSN